MSKNKNKFKGQSTTNSDRYLAYFEQFGPEHSIASLCRMTGVTRNVVYNWRKGLPKFRAREKEIREKWERRLVNEEKGPGVVGIDLLAGLDKLEAGFVELYRTTKDRVSAASAMGVSWDFIEQRLKENPRFQKAYDCVLRSLVIANEDTVLRRGATGDVTAAKVTLKARLPELYGDRVEVNQHTSLDVRITGDETVKQLGGWIKRFGRLQPAGEFRKERLLESGDDDDVIDAEAVAV